MKVLVITGSLSRRAGGLFYSVPALTRELLNNGEAEVTVLGVRDEYYESDKGHWVGLNVVACRAVMIAGNFISLQMLLHVLFHRYQLVHVHGIWNFASLSARIASVIHGSSVVVSPRGMLDPWILSRSRYLKKFAWIIWERKLLESAIFVHALCKSEAESVGQVCPKANVFISPNGVHTEPHSAEIKRSKTSGAPAKRAVFIGRIHEKKGVEGLIDAWMRLPASLPWTLEIWGWGEPAYVRSLVALAASCDGRIAFKGEVYGDDKVRVLKSSDAFLLCSYSEGLPMAVLEALNFGVPCIISKYCNLDEAIEAGAAIEVNPDAHEFGNEIARALRDIEIHGERMRDAAQQLVAQKFTWSIIGREMADKINFELTGV